MKNDLSARELAVIELAVKGYTDDMIAYELAIERGTVNSYWVRIRGKLGHLSRTELVARFVQENADKAARAANDEYDRQTRMLEAATKEIDRLRARLAQHAGGE